MQEGIRIDISSWKVNIVEYISSILLNEKLKTRGEKKIKMRFFKCFIQHGKTKSTMGLLVKVN